MGEYGRPELLVRKPGGDDDARRLDGLAIGDDDTKAARGRFDPVDHAAVEIGHRARLEPGAVGRERVERQRLDAHAACGREKSVERQRFGGIGNVGRPPRRTQPHAFWHMALPERHRLAEHMGGECVGVEVGGDREPIGPGADHDHVAVMVSGRLSRHGTLNAPQPQEFPRPTRMV